MAVQQKFTENLVNSWRNWLALFSVALEPEEFQEKVSQNQWHQQEESIFIIT